MRIAFCAAEVVPYAKTGGLGDVCGALPLALGQIGVKVDIFLPRYGSISRRKFKIKRIDQNLSHAKLAKNINVYFIESSTYFSRAGIYGHKNGEYKDNFERFNFFNTQVLESLKKLKRKVDVVHCHDWHTCLIPVYLKEKYGNDPFFAKTKTLLTIHNLAYQGLFPRFKFKKLGLNKKLFSSKVFEHYGKVNFLKAGIIYADCVSTVSPGYSKEIQTKKFGCGLDKLLHKSARKVRGILNGIDYSIWNPKTDREITRNFSAANYRQAKRVNKQALSKKLRLQCSEETPLVGSVGRLSHQKGIDLMIAGMKKAMKVDICFAIQGVGDRRFEKKLKALAKRYKGRLAVHTDFDETTAHQIYAGSDFFIMPSSFEPCGLSQMISLKYASVPVVYKTGGLADTVKSYERNSKKGNGIVFESHSVSGYIKALKSAEKLFKDQPKHKKVVQNGLRCDFTWRISAKHYKKIYQCL